MTKTLEAMWAALTVGGRLNPEKSRAVESYKYGRDPASFVKFEGERRRGVQRDIDEVEALLDLWAEWMHDDKGEGPEGHRVAVGFRADAGRDSEEMYEAADEELLTRIDAAFDSLAPIYKEAIKRKYGLGFQVFRFAKQDVTFEDAKIMMRVKLVLKGVL